MEITQKDIIEFAIGAGLVLFGVVIGAIITRNNNPIIEAKDLKGK